MSIIQIIQIITNRNFFIKYLFVFFLVCNNNILSEKIIRGNVDPNLNKSFNFNISNYAFFNNNESYVNFGVIISSGQEIPDNSFAIAKASRLTLKSPETIKKMEQERDRANADKNAKNAAVSEFTALCPPKIKINGQVDQPNPLNGAKISHLALLYEYPVVVKDKERKIYFVNSLSGQEKDAALYQSAELNDAKKKPASEIIKLEVGQLSTDLIGNSVFAAVKNNNGEPFGSDGSGIAVVHFNANRSVETNKDKTKEDIIKTFLELRVLNADASEKPRFEKRALEGNFFVEKKVDEKEKKASKNKKENKQLEKQKKEFIVPSADNKAAPFDGTIKAIKINNNAQIISDIIDIYWDKKLGRLYIACSVRANSMSNSGAKAVVVGRMTNEGKLIFDPIAPDGAFIGNNQIVGTNIANQEIIIDKVRTMNTSTLLNYLIVVSNNKVYALPLVDKWANLKKDFSQATTHGTLAKFDQEPEHYYDEKKKEFLMPRVRAFVQEAKKPEDLLTDKDQAAIVGLQNLPINSNQKISDICVVGDSVFVSINCDYSAESKPGIFYSQAILDSKGRIASWTKWQRTAGTDEKILASCVDIASGNHWYIQNSNNMSDSVRVTQWQGDKNLNSLDNYFKSNGIQEVFDFPNSSLGFDNFSMQIAIGFKKVVLMQTGSLQNNIYKPLKEKYNIGELNSNNGKISQLSANTNFVTISGGDISQLGPITCADIIADILTGDRWIVVGGIDGLAIGMDDHGRSWFGNISALNQISPKVVFKKIGKYTFVKKVQSDGKFLYVLTDKKLDRIKLSATNFKSGNLDIATLADFSDKKFQSNVMFTDFCVSDKFALLASNLGLFRVGDKRDITLAKNCLDVGWTFVNIPEGLYCISKLFLVTPTNNNFDFSQKSQVYVLSSFKGYNQSRVNRFFVNLIDDVNDRTIEPLPDFFVKDKLSNFYEFSSFRDEFWTDGATIFNACSKDIKNYLSLQTLAPRVTSNTKSFNIKNMLIDLQIDKRDSDNKKLDINQIGKIVRNSATGALLINGNFGLRINQ